MASFDDIPIQRLDSIDIMRTIAIVFMVLCHFIIFYSSPGHTYPWIHVFGNHIIGDFAAPFFLILVGVSQALSMKKRETIATSKSHQGLIRGMFIFFMGLLGLLIVQGPKDIFDWDILTLIGTSIMCIHLMKRFRSSTLLTFCLVIFILAPWIRGMTPYLHFWGGSSEDVLKFAKIAPGILFDPVGDYGAGLGISQIWMGFFLLGYFPIFPWIIFPLVGLVIGRSTLFQKKSITACYKIMSLGIISLALGIYGAFLSRTFNANLQGSLVSPLSFYPETPTMLLTQLGLALILLSLLRLFFDLLEYKSHSWISHCRRFSRYSLSIYFIHQILIFWPLWIAGWMQGSRTFYYEKAMNPLQGLFAGLIALTVFHFLLIRWDLHHGKYSLEWVLKRLSARSILSQDTYVREKISSSLNYSD